MSVQRLFKGGDDKEFSIQSLKDEVSVSSHGQRPGLETFSLRILRAKIACHE